MIRQPWDPFVGLLRRNKSEKVTPPTDKCSQKDGGKEHVRGSLSMQICIAESFLCKKEVVAKGRVRYDKPVSVQTLPYMKHSNRSGSFIPYHHTVCTVP